MESTERHKNRVISIAMGANSWNTIGTSLPERVGLLAAVGLSGLTFGRSLMPRTVSGQALATGLYGAVTYGLVTAAESAVTAIGNEIYQRVEPRKGTKFLTGRGFGYAVHAGAALAGIAAEVAFPRKLDDKLWRSMVHTSGTMIRQTAIAGTISLGVLDLLGVGKKKDKHRSRSSMVSESQRPHHISGLGQMGVLMGLGAAGAGLTVYAQRRLAEYMNVEAEFAEPFFDDPIAVARADGATTNADDEDPGAAHVEHVAGAFSTGASAHTVDVSGSEAAGQSTDASEPAGVSHTAGGDSSDAITPNIAAIAEQSNIGRGDRDQAETAPHRFGGLFDARANESPFRSAALSVAAGAGTALAVVGIGKINGLMSRGMRALLTPLFPRRPHVSTALGDVAGAGIMVASAMWGVDALYRGVEKAGDAVESAYNSQPRSPHVSGGPASLVPWTSLSREGRRFVNMVLTPTEIDQVLPDRKHGAIPPVRAFVSLGSADTPLDRAVLMMDEMERLGAFDRSIICVASPTGSGYVNYVVAETLEYLTGGDCATVTVQYSLRPSILSIDRISLGRENNLALLTLLNRRLARIPEKRRPRLVIVGESLGAQTLQDTVIHRGTDGLRDFGVERALFIGTPEGSGWAREWRRDPVVTDPHDQVVEVGGFAGWQRLPLRRKASAQYVLLTHPEDPIARFGPLIALVRPRWLDPRRENGPGVPPEMRWRPFLTFFVTLSDMLNAQNVVPGIFVGAGHDYRADLAEMTRVTFGLLGTRGEMASVETALRDREALWAARRVVAEHYEKLRTTLSGQLGDSGVGEVVKSYVDRLGPMPVVDPLTGAAGRPPFMGSSSGLSQSFGGRIRDWTRDRSA